MDTNWLLIAIFIIGLTALIGFFVTKTKGFGRFATSTFLILLVVIITGLFFATDKIPTQLLSNIYFAVIGFAGGLFTRREKKTPKDSSSQDEP